MSSRFRLQGRPRLVVHSLTTWGEFPTNLDARNVAAIPLLTVLQHVHTYGMMIQSDDARRYAEVVAEAASRNLITTEVIHGSGVHGRLWKITIGGLQLLNAGSSMIVDEELKAFAEHA